LFGLLDHLDQWYGHDAKIGHVLVVARVTDAGGEERGEPGVTKLVADGLRWLRLDEGRQANRAGDQEAGTSPPAGTRAQNCRGPEGLRPDDGGPGAGAGRRERPASVTSLGRPGESRVRPKARVLRSLASGAKGRARV
jgi:hypothetical protein